MIYGTSAKYYVVTCTNFQNIISLNNTLQHIKAFKRIIDRAGIESSFRVHDIRHSHASLIINNGGTLYDVQAALNHANSSMSERYAHLSSEKMAQTSHNLSAVVAGAINGPRVGRRA